MSVKKTSSGRWEARWRDASGAERSKTFRLKDLAVAHERDSLAARDRGDWVDPASLKLTFKEYAESWRDIQPHRPSTQKSVRIVMERHVYPTFGSRRLRTIRPSEIKAWHAKLDLGTRASKTAYVWLSAVFKAAVQDRIIPVSPCQLKLSDSDKSEAPLECLTVEQIAAKVAASPARFQAPLIVAAGSGLRPGEWSGLTVDRVDFLRAEIKVDRQLVDVKDGKPVFGPPKSKAGFRTVPVARQVIDAISAHLAEYGAGPDGLLFTTNTGIPLRNNNISIFWHASKAVLPDWAVPHDLRHFYASCLIAAGCNVKQVQRALGHESAMVTLDTYAHLWKDNDESLRKAVADTLFAETAAEPERSEGEGLS